MKNAKTSPQNVYACYTKGFQEKVSFHIRTTPHTTENLEICEKIIKEQLIPDLIGKDILNAQICEISSLPLKIGGLNIKLPSDHENYLELSKETSLELESQDPVTAKTARKNPGVRPIGVREVMRRIIRRTITKCLKNELMSLGSNYQLCLGQKCGIEYAIHTLRDQYSKTSADAVLLIDAENAFNSLNRKLALKHIKNTCPSLLTAIKNSYSNSSKLFVNKKKPSTLKKGQPRGIH